ncbi:MAG: HlyD family type I secretion periplasmic adaptor subunit [Azospirillum sp.]|nr:HlyD family type I secretion periplasmic adaptor subunit [Azospirillum sp.]
MTSTVTVGADGPSLRQRNDRRFLATAVLVLTGFALWAGLAPLDVVSNAEGEVVPASRVKALQHLEGGIVAAILVEEGQQVARGQPLIRLDPLRAQTEVAELDKRLLSLGIDAARLTAEAEGTETLVLPAVLERAAPQIAAAAHDTFETRRKRLNHELASQENLIAQRRSELRELGLRLVNNRKSLELLASQVAISANLLRGDLTSRMAHLDLLRQDQNFRTLIDADQAAQPRAEAALREATERLGTIRESFVEQARKELAGAREQLGELSQRALKFRNVEERTVLRAPVDGIVKTLAVATEGGVIQPGQTVAEIVPLEDRLVIDAQLPIQDIGYVHAGQDVRIALKTPEAAAFGHIDGRVLTVSPDSIAVAGKYAFYKVRIETRQTAFGSGERRYSLYPGMQVLCSIRLGSRTVAEYLLSPWFRSLRFAFQER